MKQKHYILTCLFFLTSILTYGQTKTTQQTFEGYYQSGWENSAFYEQNGENLYKPAWLEFDSSFQKPDSLTNLFKKQILSKGVYIKFEGTKAIDGNFGHLGASKELVTVFKVLTIDTTKTLDNFPFKKNIGLNCVSFVDTLTGMKIYSLVDSMPKPKEGELKLFEKLKDLKLKPTCGEIQSKVLVSFIVDIDGKLTGKRIIKNIEGTDLAEQVLTLIDDIEWIVGTCNGNPVPVIYQLPVRIHLK